MEFHEAMRPPFESTLKRRSGEDKFGRFHITGGPCTNCGSTLALCVHYRFGPVILPEGVKHEDTILRGVEDTYLGINCGCYAKFHRQVAHIEDKIRTRSKHDQ